MNDDLNGIRSVKINAYDELAEAVAKAGFYTNGVETYGNWHRTTVCSKRDRGNSFWVSRMQDDWYVGTWGEDVYRLPDGSRIAELCIAWLSHAPDGTSAHFEDWVMSRFGLVVVPPDECELDPEE